MDPIIYQIIACFAIALIFFVVGSKSQEKRDASKIGSAENLSKKIIDDANHEAERYKKEALIEAKEKIHALRDEQEEKYQERLSELQDMERRLIKREDNIDEKSNQIDRLDQKLNKDLDRLKQKEEKADALIKERQDALYQVSGMDPQEAKDLVLAKTRDDLVHERAQIIREEESRTRDEAEAKAREIITRTVQRYASDIVAEATVSVVSLPNDEMKGRIIGREGRNIRSFEQLTGVDLIIDDTPQAVVLSCFDPVRREKGRVALEKLILDGRIHPTRIEELYRKAEAEVEASIKEAGEEAVEAVGIRNLHPELVRTLGKLKYRTSYGQNALLHTIEVANIAAMLAEELGANVKIAKRGALLHDIGKALDHEIELSHVELGVRLARKYKESKEVIHCIEAHHDDVEAITLEAFIVKAADAISAARPGARRESTENYIKRLEDLEAITISFPGIEQAYAIQAGREIRIAVKPQEVSEDNMTVLARDIAKKIEEELEYPGQILINMTRETKVAEYAK